MDRDWAALERLDTRELHTPKFSMNPQEICMEDDFGIGGYGHLLGSFPSETGFHAIIVTQFDEVVVVYRNRIHHPQWLTQDLWVGLKL